VNKSADEIILENNDKRTKKFNIRKKIDRAISRAKKKLGGEGNASVLSSAWEKVRNSKKSDAFLKKMMLQYDLASSEARWFFKIGSGKLTRMKNMEDPGLDMSDIPALVESIVQQEEKVMAVEEDGEIFYICNLCEYRSRDKYHIREHKESKHENVRYYCDQCEYITKRKRVLEDHVLHIHEGNDFPCDQCGKRFSKSSLRSHIHTMHTGNKYQCELCKFETLHTTNLKLHIDSVHKGIQYPCGVCNYKATQYRNLKRHDVTACNNSSL